MAGYLFTVLLFGSCAYAWLAGGREGRWISLLLLTAAVLSVPASYLDYNWSRTHLPVLIVDALLLIGLVGMALRSRRYWLLWMAGFHLISVSTHAATIAQPQLKPLIYFAMQSFWSLPLLLVMVAGIMLDRRAGLPKNAQAGEAGREPALQKPRA
ncbi:MAG: hypothetical protein WDN24_03590 [Sphingomonas sp.]